MFIFISGYLTKSDEKNFYRIIEKRILRVFVPYVIWSIIYTIASIFSRNYTNILSNFLTGQSCGIYYYILVYIQLTLISPIAIKLMNSKYNKIGFFITPITLSSILYIYNFYKKRNYFSLECK